MTSMHLSAECMLDSSAVHIYIENTYRRIEVDKLAKGMHNVTGYKSMGFKFESLLKGSMTKWSAQTDRQRV